MKKIIFIMTAVVLASGMNACKAKKTDSNAPETVDQKTISALVDKHWKLIELFGNPVSENNAKEPHIVFKTENNQFFGDAGCNRFFGSYQLKGSGTITFSQAATTMMMCINMETEEKFLEVLRNADSYIIKNDALVLNKGKEPLARFVAVGKE